MSKLIDTEREREEGGIYQSNGLVRQLLAYKLSRAYAVLISLDVEENYFLIDVRY
jgi:hypothetical protein